MLVCMRVLVSVCTCVHPAFRAAALEHPGQRETEGRAAWHLQGPTELSSFSTLCVVTSRILLLRLSSAELRSHLHVFLSSVSFLADFSLCVPVPVTLSFCCAPQDSVGTCHPQGPAFVPSPLS